jgi:aryl carrier-like protein
VGQWGQGNYSAANTFLDSFVQYRQALGQPASAVDIGVMEDVGYVSQNPAVLEQFKATSAHTLREQNLMDALQLAMKNCTAPPPSAAGYRNPTQLVIGIRSTKPLSDPSNRAIWKRDVRMSPYRNLEVVTASIKGAVNEDLKQFLAAVAKEPSLLNEQSNVDFLTHEIRVRLCNFMLRSEEEIDVKQSLSALGVDSLVAIEIRNWWRQSLGLEISILEIMNSGSIERLGKIASEGLQRKYEVPAGNNEAFIC